MEIQAIGGAIQEITAELIVVNLFEGVSQPAGAARIVDAALGGAIRDIIETGDFKGKLGQSALLYTRGAIPAKRVLVAGLGEKESFDLDVLRRVAASVSREVRKLGIVRYHSVVHGALAAGLSIDAAAQAVAVGSVLGSYRFTGAKTELADEGPEIETLLLVEGNREYLPLVEAGAKAGQIVAESACLARDLANQPGNFMTPSLLAEAAAQVASNVGLSCHVLEESAMAEMGMGALLGVAQGTNEPAKFIVLEHKPDPKERGTWVIVGKGITFDSGGISLKPSEHMEDMKYDMSGAATTLGVLRAVAALDLPIHVVGLMPATENLPGGRACKPGDVLKSMSGLTIEVISTDAEGRLILADALDYAKRYQPRAVVDLATLTGACVTALGHVATGLMSSASDLTDEMKQAAAESGEKVWELPLYDEYAEQLKSTIADVKNTGGRPAGAITGGMFLKKFATGYRWAHLDIAGTAWSENTKGYQVKGATGVGVRLLVQWLCNLCRS